jgi:hypothetical protein
MKTVPGLLMIAPVVLGTVGCVSSYKHVMVSVIDSETGAPVSGAKVTTSYLTHSAFSLAITRTDAATTDADGKVLLSANYLPREPILFRRSQDLIFSPSYQVSIMNAAYQEQTGIFPSYLTDQALLARSADLIPTMPDIVVKVTSEAVKQRERTEREEQQARDEQRAEELFRASPDFWPAAKAEPYPVVEDEVGRLLVFKRWQAASNRPLGTTEDVDSIRAVVLKHMANPKSEVQEIRWISGSIVMVSSSWYTGPVAGAGYTYVLQKRKDGWTIVAHYMNYVS